MTYVVPYAQAQTSIDDKIVTVPQGSEKTVYRLAGNYSEQHDVVTIATLRGTAYRKEYDQYLQILSRKLDSLQVPHVIFQEFNDNEGTIFDYFIENDMNGSFDANELASLLPRIKRRYEEEYR